MYFQLAIVVTLLAFASAQDATAKPKAKKSPPSNHTVTDEVEMSFEIKNFDGQGEDYQGTVVIGLFGETAPMTVLNFKGICQGFKRGGSREVRTPAVEYYRIITKILNSNNPKALYFWLNYFNINFKS